MTIKTTYGAVNGGNGVWACHDCRTVNAIADRATFSQEVVCKACGHNFDLQQWDAATDDELQRVAEQHEEILAGLVGERAHSRIRAANGQPVQWSYTAEGAMAKVLATTQPAAKESFSVRVTWGTLNPKPGFVSAWDAAKHAYDSKYGAGSFDALRRDTQIQTVREYVNR